MVSFDSFNPSSGYEKSYDLMKPSFIGHDIEVRYSTEFEYLKRIREYKEGWDSYNGKAPNKSSVESSIGLLSSFTVELKKLNTLSHFPEFCLAPDGVLGLEWDYAKDSNLFARIYSTDKIEYSLTEKNNNQPPQEINSEDFIEMCKEKLKFNKVA